MYNVTARAHAHTHSHRQADRQTDRQTKRQTDRQTDRQAGRRSVYVILPDMSGEHTHTHTLQICPAAERFKDEDEKQGITYAEYHNIIRVRLRVRVRAIIWADIKAIRPIRVRLRP